MRLLLIDDEQGIREVVKAMLSRHEADVQVEEAEDGQEAWSLYQEHGPFDVVMTDIGHPAPDGIELAKLIRKKNPHQAIVVISTDLEVGRMLWRTLRIPLVMKPFHDWQLEGAIALAKVSAG